MHPMQEKLAMQVFPLKILVVAPQAAAGKIPCMESIHSRIKERRQDMGLSMESLAVRIGVAWQTVQQWENGKTSPSRRHMPRVAAALQCSQNYLYCGDSAGGPPRHDASEAHPADQCTAPPQPDIESRGASIEVVIRYGVLHAGVMLEQVIGDLNGLRVRIRNALMSSAPARSERDERGMGQENPDISLTVPSTAQASLFGPVERRTGQVRRRTN